MYKHKSRPVDYDLEDHEATKAKMEREAQKEAAKAREMRERYKARVAAEEQQARKDGDARRAALDDQLGRLPRTAAQAAMKPLAPLFVAASAKRPAPTPGPRLSSPARSRARIEARIADVMSAAASSAAASSSSFARRAALDDLERYGQVLEARRMNFGGQKNTSKTHLHSGDSRGCISVVD